MVTKGRRTINVGERGKLGVDEANLGKTRLTWCRLGLTG